jgi:hypothetical protein
MFVSCVFLSLAASSQNSPDRKFSKKEQLQAKQQLSALSSNTYLAEILNEDSITIAAIEACKSFKLIHFIKNNKERGIAVLRRNDSSSSVPFLTIHGNVQYDYLYRSYIDTPFSQNNFQQHTVQAFLKIVVKDKYPVTLNLSNRQTNSPYFRNFFDVSTRFDKQTYLYNAKQALVNKLEQIVFQNPGLLLNEEDLKRKIEKYNVLKSLLSAPDLLQKIIEEREKLYYKYKDSIKHLNNPLADIKLPSGDRQFKFNKKLPDVDTSYTDFIKQKKTELDSLEESISKLKARFDSLRNKLSNAVYSVKQKIHKAANFQELQKIAVDNNIEEEKRSGIDKFLSNVKSIGVGRSVINYSELTAWNVSLTGFNMEYNPGLYTAFAVGKIDYGFRDFFNKNSRNRSQNFIMGRIGLGDIEKKAVIFSAFAGKKYSYGSLVSDSTSDHVNIVGYSIEGILRKDEFTSITAEVAKTTRPVSGNFGDNKELRNLIDFSKNSNLGVSIKGETRIKATDTRLSGYFKKTGENFQSFSLFSYNTDQTAWLLKADQYFLKDRIALSANLRRNDFVNPFTEKTFKTTTVFKSVQLTARFPKWPSLSVGYYPGTQLYFVDKERIRENAYYILNGSLIHNYAAGNVRMISSAIYNHYSSKGTDSGFISYQGVNYVASQTFIISKLQLQGSYSFTDQERMKFYTLEGTAEYSIGKAVRLGGGAKYNKVISGEIYLGGVANASIDINRIGSLQLQYEKSYLPTIYRTLFPVEIGRLTLFKSF